MKTESKINIIKTSCGGLLLALGVLIPQIFHIFGQTAGKTLLPMHLSVLIAGLFLGYKFGFIIGLITPILSFLYTGGSMPPVMLLPFMIAELAVYGLVSGLMYRKIKLNLYVSLIVAMIAGRLCYALTLFIAGNLLHLTNLGAYAAIEATITGIPGIILQIIVVPILVMALNKGGQYGRKRLAAGEIHS